MEANQNSGRQRRESVRTDRRVMGGHQGDGDGPHPDRVWVTRVDALVKMQWKVSLGDLYFTVSEFCLKRKNNL